MIIGDAMQVPREKTTLLRLTAEELQNNYRLRAFHLRESGSGLIVAEGEGDQKILPEGYTGIAFANRRWYAHNAERNILYSITDNAEIPEVSAPYHLVCYPNYEGNLAVYCVTENGVAQLSKRAIVPLVEYNGGVCAAAYHDRIFAAKGDRLFYSTALDVRSWDMSRYGAGFLDLVWAEAGDILDMWPYKDKLYLFRRRGITCLRALGDELNFKAVHLPMKCGNLLNNSVAPCGENIGYFTDCGFYLFNGASSHLAENSRCGELDLTAAVKAQSYRGKYYASVQKKGGGRITYCYDPDLKRAHFIENGATDLAVGDGLYFVRGSAYYRMTEQGIANGFTPFLTADNIAFSVGEEKMLRALAIEGEGTFSVTVTSNRGSRTVNGSAGEVLKLRSPLRGNGFAITVSAADANAKETRFQAVQLRITEESNDN